MTTLSVVIPAFNEEDGIQEIMTRVLSIRDDLAEVGACGPFAKCATEETKRPVVLLQTDLGYLRGAAQRVHFYLWLVRFIGLYFVTYNQLLVVTFRLVYRS